MKHQVNCPLCEAQDYKTLYEPWVKVDDPVKLYGAASGIPGTQRLVRCRNCGMIYENPRYPDDVIFQGYALSEEMGHDSQFAMRAESFYRALGSLARLIPNPGAQVLDIGTAGGAFLEAARRYGYDATGLEPSHYLAAQAKARGLKIIEGTVYTQHLDEKSFDMICFWDVLEHVPNPKQDLIQIRKLLKPNGVLLINYPDIGTWMAKLTGKKFWWVTSVHLHHFTRATIKKLCDMAGYEVFYIKSYWQTLQFGYLEHIATMYNIPLSRLLERLTPTFIKNLSVSYYASQTTVLAKGKR